MIITTFDHRHASESEYRALHAFTTRLRVEMMPDDPTTPFEEAVAAWRGLPDATNMTFWVARSSDGEVLARGQVSYTDAVENAHMLQGAIQVLSEHRRQGLGRRLLERIASTMRERNRTLMITDTIGRVPAGARFVERIGGTPGLETHVHQLRIAELDRELLGRWSVRARESAPQFELGRWDGDYSEADLAAIVELRQVMSTQPLGSLPVQLTHVTPEQLRLVERMLAPRGIRRTTMVARHRPSGRFAGFTETFWKPSAPEILQQGDTGVFPEHRGHGIGRWLKAAMLEHVLAEHPEIRFVRTGNADVNAAMLSINRELGFRPYVSRTLWQVELAAIEEYLGRGALGRGPVAC
jgi:GNAT superfamily N-acetyltransferase